jgi:RNA polymerase sigma-70 factor (ECF subfamily)
MEDDDLLAAAARGDGDAFAAFYRRHGDLVLGYLRKRIADPEQAFDLAAETFAAALVTLRRYRPGRGPAAGWLLGIAQHKLLESLRRGRVEASARRRLHHESIAIDDDDLAAIEARAEAGARSLERLLAQLPLEQRAAITARVLDERDYADIALELRCSEQVVRQRVSRGLRTLRTQIGERS